MPNFVYRREYHRTKPCRYDYDLIVYKVHTRGGFRMEYVGEHEVITAIYKGDHAVACAILSEKYGFKMTADGYHLKNKQVHLIGI